MNSAPLSNATAPGTFAGLREKIPYLKELGINCIELLPIFEFDEWENSRKHPETGEQLLNYWGYSTLAFFAPKTGYAATGRLGMQVDEFKAMVKELHRAGIEVILDVVFNHTAEGDHRGPIVHGAPQSDDITMLAVSYRGHAEDKCLETAKSA